jgi:acylphosphatase
MEAVARRHFWIRGLVQGVSFRWHCAEQAKALGLAGWVRNLDDGRVEAVAEGPPDRVERLAAWCAHGPSAARVEQVEERDEPACGERGFRITR